MPLEASVIQKIEGLGFEVEGGYFYERNSEPLAIHVVEGGL